MSFCPIGSQTTAFWPVFLCKKPISNGSYILSVNLRDNQGHLGVHTEIRAVINNHRPSFNRILCISYGSPFFSLCAGKKRDINTIKALWRNSLYRIGRAVYFYIPGRAGKYAQLACREIALFQNPQHLYAYRSYADDGNVKGFSRQGHLPPESNTPFFLQRGTSIFCLLFLWLHPLLPLPPGAGLNSPASSPWRKSQPED